MARGLLAALKGDELDPDRYAFALAVSDALRMIREIDKSSAQTAACVKALIEGLAAR